MGFWAGRGGVAASGAGGMAGSTGGGMAAGAGGAAGIGKAGASGTGTGGSQGSGGSGAGKLTLGGLSVADLCSPGVYLYEQKTAGVLDPMWG